MTKLPKSVRFFEIKGFPQYIVGSDGSVWTSKVLGGGKAKGRATKSGDWRPLSIKPHKGTGYCMVDLHVGGIRHRKYAHSLVAEAFIGPRPDGHECCHKDGNRSNNSHENLKWGTSKENSDDSKRHGTTARGESHGFCKLTEKSVVSIRKDFHDGVFTKSQLAKLHGVNFSTIHSIIKRKSWKHI